MTDQSKARPFFAAYQTKQSDVGIAGKTSKNIFTSFSDTTASATTALAVTVAEERAEDLSPSTRSTQFPGLTTT